MHKLPAGAVVVFQSKEKIMAQGKPKTQRARAMRAVRKARSK